MHTFGESAAGVPAFLAKLWRLVDDAKTNNLICWSKDGRSFIIQNQAQFARELLPQNYKHNNMASFIRQLNMYGFHKITSIDNGGLRFDRDEMEFSHPCFKRNCPYLLEHIKRKIASTKSIDEKSAIKPEVVSKVLQDVKTMRGRQDLLDSRFSIMKQENEALWREIASLRQKHAKQQQIVNKLIQFLITIVQPSRNMSSVKRHMQLMINDTPDSDKLRKTSGLEVDCSPVIHEIGEELLDDTAENVLDAIDPDSNSPLNIERPDSNTSAMSQNYDCSNQSSEDMHNAVISASGSSGGPYITQTVNSDGSEVTYHVTELPDIHQTESKETLQATYGDDNILTPMVREQIAFSQILKQKNKQRHSLIEDVNTSSSISPKLMRGTRQLQEVDFSSAHEKELDIKSEQETDPMLFLSAYPDSRVITPDPPMFSPKFCEDQHRSISVGTQKPRRIDSSLDGNRSEELYNPSDFLASGIPSDIFELFNDADILDPYGLSVSVDTNADRKGSELMAYQPIYDLCDIMDVNDKTDLDDVNIITNSPSTSRKHHSQDSTLNTPCHE